MKKILLPLAYLSSMVVLAFLFANFMPVLAPVSSVAGTGIGYYSAVCVYQNDELLSPCRHNLFTNFGKNATSTALMFGTNNSVQFVAVANFTGGGSQAATDLTLAGEYFSCGLERSNYTAPKNQTASCTPASCPGNWTISYQFTSTCDAVYVNSTGLYTTPVTGGNNTLFAETTFTSANLSASDKINVTWYIWVA